MVREKMKGTAALVSAASLPDDAVREILVHVDDVADLFRCAMTCNHWCRLVLKASFVRRSRWPDHETASFLPGFFLWEKIVIKDDPTFVTRFVPAPGSVFGSDRRSLESFFPRAEQVAQKAVKEARCTMMCRSSFTTAFSSYAWIHLLAKAKGAWPHLSAWPSAICFPAHVTSSRC